MEIERIMPQSEQEWLKLRTMDITSTEVSALFGLSPYATNFELWHRKKKSEVVLLEANQRMKWGIRLQDSIAQGIAEEKGWSIKRWNEYVRIPELRMGASFDFLIDSMADVEILEIKNVDGLAFRDGWFVDDNYIEAPPHIELQVQHQMLVSGCKKAHIGALIGGNKMVCVERVPDDKIHEAIRRKVVVFWKSIDDNVEPTPDFSRDAEFIAGLYRYSEPGKVLDAKDDAEIAQWAEEYKAFGMGIKTAKSGQDEIKARLLMKIGTAEKVLGENFSISAGLIGPAEVAAHTRAGYRTFKVNWKKEKIKNG